MSKTKINWILKREVISKNRLNAWQHLILIQKCGWIFSWFHDWPELFQKGVWSVTSWRKAWRKPPTNSSYSKSCNLQRHSMSPNLWWEWLWNRLIFQFIIFMAWMSVLHCGWVMLRIYCSKAKRMRVWPNLDRP